MKSKMILQKVWLILVVALLTSCGPTQSREFTSSLGGSSATVSINSSNSLIAELQIELDEPSSVFVTYGNQISGYFKSKTTNEAAAEHILSLVRLRPQTTYSFRVFSIGEEGPIDLELGGRFRTGALPEGLAKASFSVEQGQPTFPLTLKDHGDKVFNGMVMTDSDGEVVWYYDFSANLDTRVTAIAQKENGNLIFIANFLGLREITPLGEQVDQLDEACRSTSLAGQFHHEVVILPNDKILFLSSVVHDISFDDGVRPLTSDVIAEWDQNSGDMQNLFDISDYISPTENRTFSSSDPNQVFFWRGCPANDETEDWSHSNALFVGARGNVIVSMRHLNQIISIAPDFQSIEWQLGGNNSDFTFEDPSDQFFHQHSAKELPNGNILLFDNGNFRPDEQGGEFSRALELELDFGRMVASKVWEYRNDPELFALCCSNVTRLENGNTLIVFGSDLGSEFPQNPKPANERVYTVVEADQNGSAVWKMELKYGDAAGNSIQYRVYPIYSIDGEESIEDLFNP